MKNNKLIITVIISILLLFPCKIFALTTLSVRCDNQNISDNNIYCYLIGNTSNSSLNEIKLDLKSYNIDYNNITSDTSWDGVLDGSVVTFKHNKDSISTNKDFNLAKIKISSNTNSTLLRICPTATYNKALINPKTGYLNYSLIFTSLAIILAVVYVVMKKKFGMPLFIVMITLLIGFSTLSALSSTLNKEDINVSNLNLTRYAVIDLDNNTIQNENIDSKWNLLFDNYCHEEVNNKPELLKAYDILKEYNTTNLSSLDVHIGTTYKVTKEFLSSLGGEFINNYYYNPINKSIFSIEGETYKDGIVYHTIDEYNYCLDSGVSDSIKEKVLSLKYYYIDEISNAQLSNGALPSYASNNGRVTPYFAYNQVSGLLTSMDTFDEARKYLVWHLEHINMQPDMDGLTGTIYDYNIDLDTLVETPTNDYDSADSYASMFMSLLYDYYKSTGDKSLFDTYEDEVNAIVGALEATYNDELNLTFAKVSYLMYYAMDNAEEYDGYQNISRIYDEIYNNTTKKDYFKARSVSLKQGFYNVLYNETEGVFDFANNNPSLTGIESHTIYPNINAQLYAIIYGIVNEEDNSALMTKLYGLHTYYSTSEPYKWYLFESTYTSSTPHSYSNIMAASAALKFKNKIIQYEGTNINLQNEVEGALNTLYTFKSLERNKYVWFLGESGNSLVVIDEYIKKMANEW